MIVSQTSYILSTESRVVHPVNHKDACSDPLRRECARLPVHGESVASSFEENTSFQRISFDYSQVVVVLLQEAE